LQPTLRKADPLTKLLFLIVSLYQYFSTKGRKMLFVFLYCLVFKISYITWLNPYFGYFGFDYVQPGFGLELLAWVLCLTTASVLPNRLKKVSTLFCWYLYVFVYVPSIFCLLFMRHTSDEILLSVYFSMFIGFFIIIISQYLYTPAVSLQIFKRKTFLRYLLILTFVLIAFLMFFFRGKMHIVSFTDIYDLRYENDEFGGSNPAIAYIIMLLGSLLLPYLITLGLVRKNLMMILTGFIGEVILYSINGSKQYVLSLLILFLNYFIIKKFKDKFGAAFCIGFAVAIGVIVFADSLITTDENQGFMFIVVVIVLFRSVAIGGLAMSQYVEFFSNHPLTYYSHVNLVAKLGFYPYKNLSVGQMVGEHFYGSDKINSNANFWSTDGIAALGPFGIIVASVFCLALLLALDMVSKKHSLILVGTISSMLILNLLNTSIFTSLLSGGGLYLLVLLMVTPSTNEKYETAEIRKITG
jgi:hypothetical protein